MTLTAENQIAWRKNCPSGTLSVKNPTWAANPDLCDERPAANCLRYGMA
jgi:hypothetical protein